MDWIIAVEEGLSPHQDMLKEAGMEIIDLKEGWAAADAIVVSGLEENPLGEEVTKTPAPVIVARGKTAEEVVEQVETELEEKQ